jgi:hypothetical protein
MFTCLIGYYNLEAIFEGIEVDDQSVLYVKREAFWFVYWFIRLWTSIIET